MTFLRKHNPKFGDVRGDTYLIFCMCIGQYTWQEFKVVCFISVLTLHVDHFTLARFIHIAILHMPYTI